MYLTELSAHWRAEADKTGNTALRRAADELDAALAGVLTLPGEWAEAATRAENSVRGGVASAARASATASTFRIAAGNLAGRILPLEPPDEPCAEPTVTAGGAPLPAQEPPVPVPPALAAPAPAAAPLLAAPAPTLAAPASPPPAEGARGLQAWDMTLPFDAASLGLPY